MMKRQVKTLGAKYFSKTWVWEYFEVENDEHKNYEVQYQRSNYDLIPYYSTKIEPKITLYVWPSIDTNYTSVGLTSQYNFWCTR